MEIVVLIFDGITALDAVGPYEVLSRLPGAQVKFVAKVPGMKRTQNGMLAIAADFSIHQCPKPDVIVVPGGWGTDTVVGDQDVLDWLKYAHLSSKWTTSVCTGSLILAAAGILKGLNATTHWTALDELSKYGANPVSERIVRENKIVTSAGVSAGIDMALQLASWSHGAEIAQAIQLNLEYDPKPPFSSGTPEQASARLIEVARTLSGRNKSKS